jgi:uncharacterized protein YndB with AHSA1/START domain
MTTRSVAHATFVIDRTLKHPPERVFSAFAEEEAKQKWFGGGEDCTQLHRAFDFRVGGIEEDKGQWRDGSVSHFICRYHEILPGERIVFTYDMYVDEVRLSVCLTTVEFTATEGGTRLIFTEMGAYLDERTDGAVGREQGWNKLIDQLVASLG